MLDIVLAFIIFMIITSIIMVALFTEGGGSPGISIVLALVITFMIMYSSPPIRYPIIMTIIGAGIFSATKHYFRVIRPKNKHHKKSVEFYGQQLATQLQDYRIVELEMYVYEIFSSEEKPDQIRLFIASEAYYSLITGNSISKISWEFVQLNGMPDDQNGNQLYLFLVITSDQAQSIAIPCFAGYQGNKESVYHSSQFWNTGLYPLYREGELSLYPFEQKWIKEFHLPTDLRNYFYTHIVDHAHLTIPAPALDKAIELGLIKESHLQVMRKKSQPKRDWFGSYTNHEKQETIQYAIKLCQQIKDNAKILA